MTARPLRSRRPQPLAAMVLAAATLAAAPAPMAPKAATPATAPSPAPRLAAPPPATAAQPAQKRPLPDLELQTMAGKRVRTRDLRGQVVLLDFWGTWCAPCRAAVPRLRDLNARLVKSPFTLVSISNDADRATLERFVADRDMRWTHVWDAEQEVIGRLGVRRFPTYVLVDHEGNVVFGASGWGPNVEREIEARVAEAVRAASAAAKR